MLVFTVNLIFQLEQLAEKYDKCFGLGYCVIVSKVEVVFEWDRLDIKPRILEFILACYLSLLTEIKVSAGECFGLQKCYGQM